MARVLIDPSVWIEFFRQREPYHGILDSHFETLGKPAGISLYPIP